MAGSNPLILLIAAIAIVLAAGCTAPNGTQSSTISTTTVPSPVSITSVVEVTTPSPPPATTTSIPVNVTVTPTGPSPHEIYYGDLVIFMDREGYALVNFEDIGYPILKPGDKFIVRITSDHAILVYVIRSYDTGLLMTIDGIPTYNNYDRTYDYGKLLPIMKLENIYDGGSDFTVKDLGKYTLVLDTRLSTRDYHFVNEVTKVSVRILKVE